MPSGFRVLGFVTNNIRARLIAEYQRLLAASQYQAYSVIHGKIKEGSDPKANLWLFRMQPTDQTMSLAEQMQARGSRPLSIYLNPKQQSDVEECVDDLGLGWDNTLAFFVTPPMIDQPCHSDMDARKTLNISLFPNPDSSLEIETEDGFERTVEFEDHVIEFDPTVPHRIHNQTATRRVTLMVRPNKFLIGRKQQ